MNREKSAEAIGAALTSGKGPNLHWRRNSLDRDGHGAAEAGYRPGLQGRPGRNPGDTYERGK
jgi:hypothetical protein